MTNNTTNTTNTLDNTDIDNTNVDNTDIINHTKDKDNNNYNKGNQKSALSVLNNINAFFDGSVLPEYSAEDITNLDNETKITDIVDYLEKVTNIYNKFLKRPPDIGGLKHYSNQLKYKIKTEEQIIEEFKESSEYKKLHGIPITDISDTDKKEDNKEETIKGIKDITKDDEANPQLVYCMIGGNRINEIKPYLETVLPYVDRLVYIDSFSDDGSSDYVKELVDKYADRVVLIQRKWQDKFSAFRNHYLDYLRSINYNSYVLTSDTDEHYPLETLSNLKNLVNGLEKTKTFDGITFNAEDILVNDDDINKVIHTSKSDYWKPLLFKFYPDLEYQGEPHETLVGHGIKWWTSNYKYQHIRSRLHILSRATENFWISNSNRRSDKWYEFRQLCDSHNLDTFESFWTLFEKHSLPLDIESWIIEHKDDNEDDGDSEVREMNILYNEVLPSRNKEAYIVADKVIAAANEAALQTIAALKEANTEIKDSPEKSDTIDNLGQEIDRVLKENLLQKMIPPPETKKGKLSSFLVDVLNTKFAYGTGEALGRNIDKLIKTIGSERVKTLIDYAILHTYNSVNEDNKIAMLEADNVDTDTNIETCHSIDTLENTNISDTTTKIDVSINQTKIPDENVKLEPKITQPIRRIYQFSNIVCHSCLQQKPLMQLMVANQPTLNMCNDCWNNMAEVILKKTK